MRPSLIASAARTAFAALASALVVGCAGLRPPPEPPTVPAPAAPTVAREPEAPPPPDTAPPIPDVAKPPPVVRVPGNAVPRVERIPEGAPNKPYVIRGERYVPENADVPMREIGIASWYGPPFHGRKAANGERYDMNAMTAAHPTMPLPSYARVRNLSNGREVIVRVNDRGPFHGGRIIDLSRAAARKLGFAGLALVEVERLTHDDIRTGAWRQRAAPTAIARHPAAPPLRQAQGTTAPTPAE